MSDDQFDIQDGDSPEIQRAKKKLAQLDAHIRKLKENTEEEPDLLSGYLDELDLRRELRGKPTKDDRDE